MTNLLGEASLDVLDSLATRGSMRVDELIEHTGRHPNQVHFTLAGLKRRGLVGRDGKRAYGSVPGCVGATYYITVRGFLRLERKGMAA